MKQEHSTFSGKSLTKVTPASTPEVHCAVAGIKQEAVTYEDMTRQSVLERVQKSIWKKWPTAIESSDREDPVLGEIFWGNMEIGSEEEFRQFFETLEKLLEEANGSPCSLEVVYYSAGEVVPQFHKVTP